MHNNACRAHNKIRGFLYAQSPPKSSLSVYHSSLKIAFMSFTTQHQFNIKLINPSMLPVSLAVLPQKSHKRLLYGQTAFFSYIYYADRILTKQCLSLIYFCRTYCYYSAVVVTAPMNIMRHTIQGSVRYAALKSYA